MLATVVGVVIGFGAGFGLKQIHIGQVAKMWLRVPGDIYIRLLTLTILPMIASSIISGVLFCSVLFGIGINRVKQRGLPFKEFFQSMSEVVMYVMQKLLLTTPVGVCFMVLSSVVSADDIGGKFKAIGMFLLFNIAGIFTHFLFLCLSLLVLKRNPLRLLRYCLPPWFISFATTSGTIAIPRCFEAADAYGIPKSVSRFVLPLAGTMKSDSSAVFIVGSCLFVAQGMSINLDPAKIVIIVNLATAYVTALPNIPSASVVAIITILSSIGVGSKDDVSILYTVEFINDRLRSGNIALSHMFCTAFTYHLCEKDLGGETDDRVEEDDSLDQKDLKSGKFSVMTKDDSDLDQPFSQKI
nr:unnamed protein product [Spirometra erinaceieuropaei]